MYRKYYLLERKIKYNKLGSSSSISIDAEGIELNRFIRGRRVSVVSSDGKSVDEWWSINSWTQLLRDFIIRNNCFEQIYLNVENRKDTDR